MAKKNSTSAIVYPLKKSVDPIWIAFFAALIVLVVSSITYKQPTGENVQAGRESLIKSEAEYITKQLIDNNDLGAGSSISESKISELSEMGYLEVKDKLNTDSEFCIYFEDDSGKIIEVADGVQSIGSGDIKINGVPCGE